MSEKEINLIALFSVEMNKISISYNIWSLTNIHKIQMLIARQADLHWHYKIFKSNERFLIVFNESLSPRKLSKNYFNIRKYF